MSTEPSPSNIGHQELAGGALGPREVIFQAISHLGPAIGVIIVAPVIATLVGASMPLIILIAMLAVLLTGSCVAMLAAKLASAGGYYSYVSHGLGERAGFVTAWAYFLYDPIIPTLMILATAGVLEPAIQKGTGIDIPWWVITVVLLAAVWAMTLRGARLSAGVTMALGAFECLIVIGFAIAVLAHTGSAALTLHPFTWPATGGSFQPVVLAFAFGVLLFTGFESAAPLAAETARPHRAIPRTVLISIIVVGLIWTLAAYAIIVSWHGAATNIGTSGGNPFFTLADQLSGWAWIILALALLNSAIAGALAGQNAGARVVYALGKAQLLPRFLGQVHARFRTPARALTMIFLLNVLISVTLGTWLGPVGAFAFIGLFVTLGVLVVYIMGNLAVPRLYWRRFRTEFHWFKHLVIPVLGSAILVLGLYFSVIPWPAWPLNLAVVLVAAWLAIGIGLAVLLGRSRKAALRQAAELIFAGEDTADPTPISEAGSSPNQGRHT